MPRCILLGMNMYRRSLFPRILDWIMRRNAHKEKRAAVIGGAHGVVVEVGFGSGLNLPHYKNVEKLYAVDPSRGLFDLAKGRIGKVSFPVEYFEVGAEKIPLEDSSADSIVMTWSLCSIPDPFAALKEMGRVLKDDGKVYFIEHGLSENKAIARIQRLINPLWKRLAGGCNLDRKTDGLLEAAGFTFLKLEKSGQYLKPLGFEYKGVAVKSPRSAVETF
jgi:ubiquinone/menaquinone biosynthesis C-methylase UbiE